jgi:hypothetical protein
MPDFFAFWIAGAAVHMIRGIASERPADDHPGMKP